MPNAEFVVDSSTNPELRTKLRNVLVVWQYRMGHVNLPIEDMITDIVAVVEGQ